MVAKIAGISQEEKKEGQGVKRANYSSLFFKDAFLDTPMLTYHWSESGHVVTVICKGGGVFSYTHVYMYGENSY